MDPSLETRRPPRTRPLARTPTPDADRAAETPQRTCVGCRSTAPRHALLRIARSDAGPVLDRRGALPGRGAYVHPDRSCVDLALAKGANAVLRALRAGSDPDAAARLKRDIEGELTA